MKKSLILAVSILALCQPKLSSKDLSDLERATEWAHKMGSKAKELAHKGTVKATGMALATAIEAHAQASKLTGNSRDAAMKARKIAITTAVKMIAQFPEDTSTIIEDTIAILGN